MSADATGREAMADKDGGSGQWGKNSLSGGSVKEKFSKFSYVFIFTYHHIPIFFCFNFYCRQSNIRGDSMGMETVAVGARGILQQIVNILQSLYPRSASFITAVSMLTVDIAWIVHLCVHC